MNSSLITNAGRIIVDLAAIPDLEIRTAAFADVLRLLAEALLDSDAYGPVMDCADEIEAQAKINLMAAEREKW